jgi:hypothetical protein
MVLLAAIKSLFLYYVLCIAKGACTLPTASGHRQPGRLAVRQAEAVTYVRSYRCMRERERERERERGEREKERKRERER